MLISQYRKTARRLNYTDLRHSSSARAGPPHHQTHHQTDAGVQGLPRRAHHPVRHRNRAHDPQRTYAERRRHNHRSGAILFASHISIPTHS